MTEPKQLVKAEISGPRGLMRPVADPGELLRWHDEVNQLVRDNLKDGIDYGVIPGTGDKPALLKPGAEKLCQAFGLVPHYEIIEQNIDHDRTVQWQKRKKKWNNRFQGDKTFSWDDENGTSIGLYRYVLKCQLKNQEGRVVGEGVGSCSSLESKYIDRPRDCENTVLKMAKKRAQVDVVLSAFSLSNRFTQDAEEIRENRVAAEVPIRVEPKAEAPSEFYSGSPEQQRRLMAVLEKERFDESLWEKASHHLMGKPTNMAAVKEAMTLAIAEAGTI